jgi:hypothetical protein
LGAAVFLAEAALAAVAFAGAALAVVFRLRALDAGAVSIVVSGPP